MTQVQQLQPVKVNEIVMTAGTQMRSWMNTQAVSEYAALMKEGVRFDPIDLYLVDDKFVLVNGFHRVNAAIRAGVESLDALITVGTMEEALWASIAANKKNALKRNESDIRQAIEAALLHPNGAALSNRQIAEHVGCTHPTVGSVREKLVATGKVSSASVRTGKDGRSINTANIGASKPDLSLEERFPDGCHVLLTNGRLKVVRGYQNNHLIVSDPMLPPTQMVEELIVQPLLRLASEREIQAYCHPPFPVGSNVIVHGSPVVGKVTDTIIGKVAVLYSDDRSGHSFWVSVQSVSAVPDASQQSAVPRFDAHRNALERAYVYRGNDTEGWHIYSFGNYQGREGLDLLVQDGLIEAQSYETPKERLRITAKGCEWLGKPLASWMLSEESEEENPILTPTDGLKVGDWVVVKNGPARQITEIIDDKYIWATGYGRAARAVVTKINAPDDDGPYDNGTLDDYHEDDELQPKLPPAPYRLDRKLQGGLAIFDGDGHSFMYFVGLSEEAEKQLGTSIVVYLNQAIAGQLSFE